LEIAASRFDLSSLVNSDRSRIALGDLEALIRERLEAEVEPSFGIRVQQVGIERLTLPSETLDATVARMSAERLTAAQERKAEGSRLAAEIRSAADRDARIALAEARTAAAETEAEARRQASAIYGASYRANPELYGLLRSLDTLGQIVGDNTRLILRTDAAPFRALVDNPAEPTPPRAAVPPVATPPGAWPQAALPRTAAPEQRP
jgi:membrane protease subunit HflC